MNGSKALRPLKKDSTEPLPVTPATFGLMIALLVLVPFACKSGSDQASSSKEVPVGVDDITQVEKVGLHGEVQSAAALKAKIMEQTYAAIGMFPEFFTASLQENDASLLPLSISSITIISKADTQSSIQACGGMAVTCTESDPGDEDSVLTTQVKESAPIAVGGQYSYSESLGAFDVVVQFAYKRSGVNASKSLPAIPITITKNSRISWGASVDISLLGLLEGNPAKFVAKYLPDISASGNVLRDHRIDGYLPLETVPNREGEMTDYQNAFVQRFQSFCQNDLVKAGIVAAPDKCSYSVEGGYSTVDDVLAQFKVKPMWIDRCARVNGSDLDYSFEVDLNGNSSSLFTNGQKVFIYSAICGGVKQYQRQDFVDKDKKPVVFEALAGDGGLIIKAKLSKQSNQVYGLCSTINAQGSGKAAGIIVTQRDYGVDYLPGAEYYNCK